MGEIASRPHAPLWAGWMLTLRVSFQEASHRFPVAIGDTRLVMSICEFTPVFMQSTSCQPAFMVVFKIELV